MKPAASATISVVNGFTNTVNGQTNATQTNSSDMENSKNQIFDPWIMKLSKLGLGLEDILRNRLEKAEGKFLYSTYEN